MEAPLARYAHRDSKEKDMAGTRQSVMFSRSSHGGAERALSGRPYGGGRSEHSGCARQFVKIGFDFFKIFPLVPLFSFLYQIQELNTQMSTDVI